ncbi:hypothetical protein [Arthrospiribacter ruber]|uniref:Lipoprotein n=1 Tax=Arthrospiribacter ruber TaxID=2487934 RepID=A0A951IXE9_9BACT|nr:hypothetical protein [Arthrospiribacter ruber]MBW3467822.1 hypothetical protein [Arthrospiribacter ruber]
MKKFLLLALIPLLFSCKNTKFFPRQYCSVCLQNADLVLMDFQIPGLTFREEQRLYQIIEKQFSKRKDIKFGLLEDWDYEIIANQINPGETAKLKEILGIDYILQVGLKGYKNSEGFDWFTPDENQALYPTPRVPGTSNSTIEMKLISTETGRVVFTLDLITQTIEYGKDTQEGSAFYFDSGTVWGSMKTGTRRGSKYLLADCRCPKGIYVRWSKILHWL